jgi:hypothetical protein
MTDFRGNIDHWLRQSEPDYYMFFLKAWIPFNAWYVAELPNLNKKDTLIIKELQESNSSKPKLIIENYLTSKESADALKFRSHLAELHMSLESKSLKHNGKKLSFQSLYLSDNPDILKTDVDKLGYIYKAEKKAGYFQALIVAKNGKTILDFKQPSYNISDLEKNNDYIRIDKSGIKRKILNCYKYIDPTKPISLISDKKNKVDCIVLDSKNHIHFIKEPTVISKGCISILYALRCMHFHGELEPTNANKPIYEHAYYLLRLIIKELN